MSAHRLVIGPGAARPLPPGERPWRVRRGEVEVYLNSAERRRLIAVASEGQDIFPTTDAALTLSLLATATADLEQRPPADPARWLQELTAFAELTEPPWPPGTDMGACYAALEARFAEIDDARDDQLAEALSRQGREELRPAGSTAAALGEAADALGVDLGGQVLHAGPSEFEALPTLARLASLRAAQVRLDPRWWRHDLGGPLIVRRADGLASALHRTKGAWRDRHGVAVDPAACDSLAYRVFPPLDHDVSRFAGMGRSVLHGVRSEIWLIAGAGLG
ncbi:hypothetical protein, partial [uncultured Phenylobacterium sp.]|uniref:hypothetical protein n=1 Tax=uncultured Phenylobacterium sp. TaxID=349273 RepID=UPI0025DB90CB